MTSGRAVARAGVIVSLAFLAARILGWVRIVVIGNTVTPASDLDAFFAAFRIPDLIFQLVAAGALSSALIPVVAGLLAADETSRAWRVVSTIANLVLMALLVLAVIVFIAAPVLVPVFTPGFDQATMDLTVTLTRIMLLSPIFLSLGAVATSVLNATGRFAAAAIAPVVYNLAIIGGTVLLYPSMGVAGVAVGVVAGAACHLLIQLRPLARLGFRYRPRVEADDPAARRALVLMAPRALGLGGTQLTFLIVTALASNLGPGAVSAFFIAFSIVQIPIGVIGVPLGVVLFPTLSREAAVGRDDTFVRLLTHAMRLLLFVMIPVSVVSAILAEPAVRLLFGSSFDEAALQLTASTLLAFLIGLPAHALIAVLARSFYARQDTLTPVLAALGAVVVNTTLAVLFVGPLGLPGIALAIAIAAWLEAGALTVILRRRIQAFRPLSVAPVVLATLAASVIAALPAIATFGWLEQLLGQAPGIIGLIVEMTLVTAVFGAVHAAVSLVLRVPELPTIVGVMVDVVRRPRRS